MPGQTQKGGGGRAANHSQPRHYDGLGGQNHAPVTLPSTKEPAETRSRYAKDTETSPLQGCDPRTVQPVDESLYRLSYAVWYTCWNAKSMRYVCDRRKNCDVKPRLQTDTGLLQL